MKEISINSVKKFLNAQKFSQSNTVVKVYPNVTVLELFGNEIAYLYNDPERTLEITTTGWYSQTTKERLNAIPNVHIVQANHILYLNGKKWDGSLTKI